MELKVRQRKSILCFYFLSKHFFIGCECICLLMLDLFTVGGGGQAFCQEYEIDVLDSLCTENVVLSDPVVCEQAKGGNI